MIGCHASDHVTSKTRVRSCRGIAHSSFFSGDQSDAQKPHVIFYRPTDPVAAIAAVNKENSKAREWYLEHYMKGGSLMRFPDVVSNHG